MMEKIESYSDFLLLSRDRFAIAAMQGWLAADAISLDGAEVNSKTLAERCYILADAMLVARKGK